MPMPKNSSTSLIIVRKTRIQDRLPALFSSGNWYKQSPFADKSAPALEHFVSIVITANLSQCWIRPSLEIRGQRNPYLFTKERAEKTLVLIPAFKKCSALTPCT